MANRRAIKRTRLKDKKLDRNRVLHKMNESNETRILTRTIFLKNQII